MNCPSCKSQCIETDSFCMKCGFNLSIYKQENLAKAEKICPDCSSVCAHSDSVCKNCGFPFVVASPKINNENKLDKVVKPIVPEEKSKPVNPIKIEESFEKAHDSEGIGIKVAAIIAVLVIISCVIFFVIKYNKPTNIEVPIISSTDTTSSEPSQNAPNITDQERHAAEAAAARPVDTIVQEVEYGDDYASNNNQIQVGSKLGGGVVAYIFQPVDSKYVEGETHGMILSPEVGPTKCFNEAEDFCETLFINGENGWKLPSLYELEKIAPNIHQLAGDKAKYNAIWTTTNATANEGYAFRFDYKSPFFTYHKEKKLYVRGIKYF